MPTVTRPNVMMAPWWSDFRRATADNKLTKAEVAKYIAPHRDRFEDKSYGKAVNELLKYDGAGDVKVTRYAAAELKKLLADNERPHIWWPTHDQLTRTYGGIVDSAMQSGRAVRLEKAPEGIDGAPRFDITPAGLVGVRKDVFLVDGKLFLKVTSTCFPTPPAWFDCGPAPLF